MKKCQNICIITQEYPDDTNFGGIAIFYKNLVDDLLSRNFKVTVITRATSFKRKNYHTNNYSVYRIGFPFIFKYFTGRFLDKILFSLMCYMFFLRLSKKEDFNLIESTETYFEGLFLNFNKNFSNKMVVQCHGSNNINVIPKGIFSLFHVIDFKLCFLLEKLFLKKSKNIIVASKSVYETLINSGLDSNKIKILSHGVNTEKFIPKIKRSPSNIIKMLFVGKIQFMKGSDFLWKILDELKAMGSITLNLVGDVHVNEKDNLDRYLKSFPNILKYTGKVKNKKMIGIYQNHDVLIHPSRSEQFGLVYAEAMSSGLMVIAGQSNGSREIIEDQVDGFLFDPDKDLNLVISILKKIKYNRQWLYNFVKKSRNKIINKFSSAKIIESRILIYKNI